MLSFFSCLAMPSLHEFMCGMSIASVKQSLMVGVTVVHRISCTAIKPRHGRGGTAQHAADQSEFGNTEKDGDLQATERGPFNSTSRDIWQDQATIAYLRMGSHAPGQIAAVKD
jgi:hypothetical protein